MKPVIADDEFVILPDAPDFTSTGCDQQGDWAIVAAVRKSPNWADIARAAPAEPTLIASVRRQHQLSKKPHRLARRGGVACTRSSDADYAEDPEGSRFQAKSYMKNMSRRGVRLSAKQQRGGSSHGTPGLNSKRRMRGPRKPGRCQQ